MSQEEEVTYPEKSIGVADDCSGDDSEKDGGGHCSSSYSGFSLAAASLAATRDEQVPPHPSFLAMSLREANEAEIHETELVDDSAAAALAAAAGSGARCSTRTRNKRLQSQICNNRRNRMVQVSVIMSLCLMIFVSCCNKKTMMVAAAKATTSTVAPMSMSMSTITSSTTADSSTTSTISDEENGGNKLTHESNNTGFINCPSLTEGQCQQNTLLCTWNATKFSCDYQIILKIESPPPVEAPSSSSPTYSPTLQGDPTYSPIVATGGTKVITETPTMNPTVTPPVTTPEPTPSPIEPFTTMKPTLFPTRFPTTEDPTKEPTMKPIIMTKSPTRSPVSSPTNLPTPQPSPPPTLKPTFVPTNVPTVHPTDHPTESPSASPSASPTISHKPTPLIFPSASPTVSSSPTLSPSNLPTPKPSSSSPTPIPTTLSPLPAGVTHSPTPPKRVLTEATSITLKNAHIMKEGSLAYQVWMDTTKNRISRYASEMIQTKSGEKNVDVVVTLTGVVQQGSSSSGNRRRRRLGDVAPLQLTFDTTLNFDSDKSNWDGSALVAAGFITVSQQNEYISDLKKGTDWFDHVQSMVMSVSGKVITETDDNKNKATSNTMTYIIAGVVVGLLVLFALCGGMYHVRRRRDSSENVTKSVSEGKYPQKSSSNFYSGYDASGTMMSSPPSKSSSPPSHARTESHSGSPVGDYFGTIQSRHGEDDVSTLGDPYIGDVHVNPGMDCCDATVTESLMSSGNDMFVYGVRPRMDTGDSSRMGGGGASTVNDITTARMTFKDDGTIEEFYGMPDRTNFHSEKDANYEHITVVASSGVLGVVIDNPTRNIPIIHAIKETSVLHGRVRVGDLLMSVDEVDCRGMAAAAVSQLISSRSQNPTRTLRLLRGADPSEVRGDASAF